MSYFPDRRSGIDPAGIADALSESLNPANYGSWASLYGDVIRLDTHAAVGNYAISAYSAPGVVIEQGSMVFNLAKSLDLSSFEKLQFMIAAIVGSNDNLTGTGYVIFTNGNWGYGVYAQSTFQFTKGTQSQGAQYYTKTMVQTDFQVYGAFDWSNVSQIIFLFDTQNRNPFTWDGYTILLDGGPFILISSSPSQLAILAQDGNGNPITYGKHMQLCGPSGGCSSENVPWGPFAVSPSGAWTVTILDSDFIKWTDNQTNRTRTFNIAPGQTITAIAVFQSGGGTGGGGGVPSTAIIASVSFIGIILGVYLLTRKK